MQQNQQEKKPYQRIKSTIQITRSMKHKDRSRNYKTIQSGVSVTIRNYNGVKSITTRNYRKVA